MKKMMIAISVTTAMVSIAQASSGVLLQVRTAGGMPGPGGPFSRTTQITEAGIIQTISGSARKVVTAKLSKQALGSLKSQIEKLQVEPLTEPSGPECADAPSTIITVTKADGSEVVIAETINCRPSSMPRAYNLEQVAEQVSGLSSILQR